MEVCILKNDVCSHPCTGFYLLLQSINDKEFHHRHKMVLHNTLWGVLKLERNLIIKLLRLFFQGKILENFVGIAFCGIRKILVLHSSRELE